MRAIEHKVQSDQATNGTTLSRKGVDSGVEDTTGNPAEQSQAAVLKDKIKATRLQLTAENAECLRISDDIEKRQLRIEGALDQDDRNDLEEIQVGKRSKLRASHAKCSQLRRDFDELRAAVRSLNPEPEWPHEEFRPPMEAAKGWTDRSAKQRTVTESTYPQHVEYHEGSQTTGETATRPGPASEGLRSRPEPLRSSQAGSSKTSGLQTGPNLPIPQRTFKSSNSLSDGLQSKGDPLEAAAKSNPKRSLSYDLQARGRTTNSDTWKSVIIAILEAGPPQGLHCPDICDRIRQGSSSKADTEHKKMENSVKAACSQFFDRHSPPHGSSLLHGTYTVRPAKSSVVKKVRDLTVLPSVRPQEGTSGQGEELPEAAEEGGEQAEEPSSGLALSMHDSFAQP